MCGGASPRELLNGLREACARTKAEKLVEWDAGLDEINEAIVAEVRSGNRSMIKMIEDEILGWNGSAKDRETLLFVVFLIQDLARSDAIIPFARNVLQSTTAPRIVKERVLAQAGLNPQKLFSRADQLSVVEIAARDKDPQLHRRAIQYLLGFRIGKKIIAEGVDQEKGKERVRHYAAREDGSFGQRQWYLQRLAELGEGRDTYVAKMKAEIDNPKTSPYIRLAYAKDLASLGERDDTRLKRLEAEYEQSRKNIGHAKYVRTRIINGKVFREEYADPTTMPSGHTPVTQPVSSCPGVRKH